MTRNGCAHKLVSIISRSPLNFADASHYDPLDGPLRRRFVLDIFHIIIGKAEMMADFMDEHMGDEMA